MHSYGYRDSEGGHLEFGGLQHAPFTSLYRFVVPDCCPCGASGNYGRPRASRGQRLRLVRNATGETPEWCTSLVQRKLWTKDIPARRVDPINDLTLMGGCLS